MSRLIDADVLINLLLTENQRCITSTGHELSVNMINSFIKNQPTAFDTEKVVEQLEEDKRKQAKVARKALKQISMVDLEDIYKRIVNGFVSAFKILGEAFTNAGNSLEVK